ncbi:MAG: hypothetical protein KGJ60_13335, partial [Verrucomicrobiota bacterium]|nr:hypothetical protein [Verrucomicrobiota bacterium]
AMKMPRRTLRAGQGVVILACLIGTLVISLMLVGMLLTVENENAMASRSQAWNRSMVVAEAGIEEGLALVNQNVGTSTVVTNWSDTATTDGWTVTNNTYHVQRQVGTDSSYYDVYVSVNSSNLPVIKSTGTTVWTGPTGVTNLLTRTVQVTTAFASYAQDGPTVMTSISLSGGSYLDGFNSQDPNYSTNGQYSPSLATADFNLTTIASNKSPTTVVTTSGGSIIHAHVNIGPNDAIASGTIIGDVGWKGPGIESGWTNNTVNLDPPPDVVAPTGVSWQPMPTMTNKMYVFNGFGPGVTNYYKVPGTLYSTEFLITNGPVVLITTNINMAAGSSVVVATNSTLDFYFSGNKPQFSGGSMVNQSGYAKNVNFWGLPDCTTFNYSGGSPFWGVVYMPEAAVKWSGGSDAYGNFTINSLSCSSGSTAFHYDLSLAKQQSPGGYFVTSWQEVLP